MTDLNDLAARVEALTGPDREVDARIQWREFGPFPDDLTITSDIGQTSCEWGSRRFARSDYVPRYTASIDAAMTLVPEGAGLYLNRYWIGKRDGPAWLCEISSGGIPSDPLRVYAADDAYSAALALTAAALRARSQQGENGNG